MNYNKRNDPYTGQEFIPMRFNQVYSSRATQIAANNSKARKKRHQKSLVDRKLDKNREILISVLGNNDSIQKSKEFMLGAGFDFMFFSQSAAVGKFKCQFVYEYYIIDHGDAMYTIKKHVK